jgi:hypothetical protein
MESTFEKKRERGKKKKKKDDFLRACDVRPVSSNPRLPSALYPMAIAA